MGDDTPSKRGPGRPKGSGKKKPKREVPPADGAASKPSTTPAPSSMKAELKLIAAEHLVSILWGFSWGLMLVFGGKLESLSKAELEDGRTHALPLLDKFPIVALVLSFLGLPVWLTRKILAKVTFPSKSEPKEEPPQVEAPPASSAASTSSTSSTPERTQTAEEIASSAPSNVTQIHQPRGA